MILEVCIENYSGAYIAVESGADRLEVCAALSEGGLSPSWSLLEQIRQNIDKPLMVMVRPRGGDFLYDSQEYQLILREIAFLKAQGFRYVVVGLLTAQGKVDKERMKEIIDLCEDAIEITFHRAFDLAKDMRFAMDDLLHLGIQRLLTSGQATSAWDGREAIAALVKQAGDEMEIVAGAGVRSGNVVDLVNYTGVRAVHASCRGQVDSAMEYKNPNVYLGASREDDYKRFITQAECVKKLAQALKTYKPN